MIDLDPTRHRKLYSHILLQLAWIPESEPLSPGRLPLSGAVMTWKTQVSRHGWHVRTRNTITHSYDEITTINTTLVAMKLMIPHTHESRSTKVWSEFVFKVDSPFYVWIFKKFQSLKWFQKAKSLLCTFQSNFIQLITSNELFEKSDYYRPPTTFYPSSNIMNSKPEKLSSIIIHHGFVDNWILISMEYEHKAIFQSNLNTDLCPSIMNCCTTLIKFWYISFPVNMSNVF